MLLECRKFSYDQKIDFAFIALLWVFDFTILFELRQIEATERRKAKKYISKSYRDT